MIYLLHQTVDEMAKAAGEREAFCVPGRSLNYAELAAASNRLAHQLVDSGVMRGDRVGIFLPRGLESVIAVFGIMKAGAVFVPIDPHVPVAALRRLINNCGISVLISHDTQMPTLQAYARAHGDLELVIGIGTVLTGGITSLPWSSLDSYPGESAPAIRMTEDDLAYIMYSSGSTGRPKGIMHTHRSGLAYARLSVATYGVHSGDRIANHSPLHFDMSTFGYFSSPLAGATTVMIPEAYTKIAASLAQLMEMQRITIWYSVPLALIQLLLRGVIESRDLSSLRWVMFGGEPFPVKHLTNLMRAWPQACFSNVYGPAEVNQCTYFHIPRREDGAPDLADGQSVPIGTIWPNTEGVVLDDDDQAVAPGEPGELMIRSPTMMQGYWARPDLNDRAFYRDQRNEAVDKVYYRTGDLVRLAPGGNLLFLGRKDRQVKVRGYRVELDDVEHALALHPEVNEAAVFPVRQNGNVARIEAAILANEAVTLEPGSLRAYLNERLSPYAVPEVVRLCTNLPRTTSGKIDRRALQAAAEQPENTENSR